MSVSIYPMSGESSFSAVLRLRRDYRHFGDVELCNHLGWNIIVGIGWAKRHMGSWCLAAMWWPSMSRCISSSHHFLMVSLLFCMRNLHLLTPPDRWTRNCVVWQVCHFWLMTFDDFLKTSARHKSWGQRFGFYVRSDCGLCTGEPGKGSCAPLEGRPAYK